MKMSFVVAGAQKAGTTALHHFLRQHPDIFLPDRKELHFFDDEKMNWAAPDYDLLHRYFANSLSYQCWGEVTPIYLYWPPSMARLHAYNSRLRIIVSLRDPSARAYSHWRMATDRGHETLPFGEAIRAGRQRMTMEYSPGHANRWFSYVERGFYAEQLRRVMRFFPRRNILVIDQGQLKTQHTDIMDKICDFLELSRFKRYPAHDLIFPHSATAPQATPVADRAYLDGLYEADLRDLRTTFGINLRKSGSI